MIGKCSSLNDFGISVQHLPMCSNGGESFEGLEAFGVVVGIDEVFEVLTKFIVSGVVTAFDGGLFEYRVQAFNLSVGRRMVRFGERVFDAVFPAAHVEHVGDVPGCGAVFVTRRKGNTSCLLLC